MFTKAIWDNSFIFNSIRLRREWLIAEQRVIAELFPSMLT